jgi:hypothetical protein
MVEQLVRGVPQIDGLLPANAAASPEQSAPKKAGMHIARSFVQPVLADGFLAPSAPHATRNAKPS